MKRNNQDTCLFETVAEEIEKGFISKGLWARALSDSEGQKDRTQARYIILRVDELKEEINAHKEAQRATEEQIQKIERQKHFRKVIRPIFSTLLIWMAISIFIAYLT